MYSFFVLKNKRVMVYIYIVNEFIQKHSRMISRFRFSHFLSTSNNSIALIFRIYNTDIKYTCTWDIFSKSNGRKWQFSTMVSRRGTGCAVPDSDNRQTFQRRLSYSWTFINDSAKTLLFLQQTVGAGGSSTLRSQEEHCGRQSSADFCVGRTRLDYRANKNFQFQTILT